MTPNESRPWTYSGGGVVLRVRVTPKSSRDAVEGLEGTPHGPALKVRVRAVADRGAANAAVAATVARWLGVPKGTVTLVSGTTARVKSLAIAGDAAALSAQLERRLGACD